MTKAVFFDLDGTLLPMDFDVFMRAYLLRLSTFASRRAPNPLRFMNSVREGMVALSEDVDGIRSNKQVFWDAFYRAFGEARHDYESICMEFYETAFPAIGNPVKPNALADAALSVFARKGYRLVLATNPVFPRVATLERCRWAQLDPQRFELITTYEDFHHIKPDLDYYREVLERTGLEACDCTMVGNNVDEDMIAADLGMGTFLVTPYLLNPGKKDLASYRSGTLADLFHFAQQCPVVRSA